MLIQGIMDITQPFVFMFAVALRFIAKKDGPITFGLVYVLKDLGSQAHPFADIGHGALDMDMDGGHQIGEKCPLTITGLIFGLDMVGRDIRILAC